MKPEVYSIFNLVVFNSVVTLSLNLMVIDIFNAPHLLEYSYYNSEYPLMRITRNLDISR